jgi:tetratricopeptide repeat protein 21B
MSNILNDVRVLINYYARVKWYSHVQSASNEILRKKGNDPVLLFWKTFGLACEGEYHESVRDFESIRYGQEL